MNDELSYSDWHDLPDDNAWGVIPYQVEPTPPRGYEEKCHANWSDTLYEANQKLVTNRGESAHLLEQYTRATDDVQHTKRMLRAFSGLLDRQPDHERYQDRLIQLQHFKEIFWNQLMTAKMYQTKLAQSQDAHKRLTYKLYEQQAMYKTQLESAMKLDIQSLCHRVHQYRVALPDDTTMTTTTFPATFTVDDIMQALSIQYNRPTVCIVVGSCLRSATTRPPPNRSVIRCRYVEENV